MEPDPIDDSIRLFAKWTGENEAADELFDRYVSRLTSLVRARMSDRLARRLDAEDVVQSAYRSFFLKAKEGRFEINESGDLWRLLAAITLNKLAKQIEKHQAAKRDFRAEADPPGGDTSQAEFPAVSPGPEAGSVVMMEDEIMRLMSGLDELQATMLSMRLAGYQIDEIATETGRNERTVRRTLDKVKQELHARL